MLKKYQNEVAGLANRIDLQSKSAYIDTSVEIKDITSEAMDFDTTLQETAWSVKEVGLLFSGAAARDFTISKKSVANIIFGRNDRFWITVEGKSFQRITIDEGVYDSTALAAEIKSKLDATYTDLSVTFTVTFNASNQFVITNSGGLDMTFHYVNERVGVRRNSTLAGNIGFTEDQGPSTTLTSDTAIDLDSEYIIISETANTDTSYVLTDEVDMDSDSALSISTSTAGITVTAKVTYQRG